MSLSEYIPNHNLPSLIRVPLGNACIEINSMRESNTKQMDAADNGKSVLATAPRPVRRYYESCDPEQSLLFAQIHHLHHDTLKHSQLIGKRHLLMIYVFALLVYVGVNIALLGSNFKDQDIIEENYFKAFHYISFWGFFFFTFVEAGVLITTGIVSWNNRLLSTMVLFNVMATFATALLISIDIEIYEVATHYMEYTVQVTISAVNLIFLNTYVQSASPESFVYKYQTVEVVVLCMVLVFSIFQLSLYAGYPVTRIGGERAAHFAEFVTEIFNGMFALLFAALSYSDVDKQLEEHQAAMKYSPGPRMPVLQKTFDKQEGVDVENEA